MTGLAKLLLRCLLRLLYRVEVSGMENYHETGERALIVANHTSLLDGILLYAWLPDTPTFAINTQVAAQGSFKPFLKFVDLFEMDPSSPLSIKSMIKFIKGNRKAVIFPEGRITVTGALMKVYEGPALVADKAEAMILPIAIDGCQFSPFSYMKGKLNVVTFPQITMRVLPPQSINVSPEIQGHARRKAAAAQLQRIMYGIIYASYDHRQTVFSAILEAARKHGHGKVVLEDINRDPLNYRQILTRVFVLAGVIEKNTEPGEHVGLLLPNVNGAVITYLSMQFLNRVPAVLNYSAGTQVLLSACETAAISTVYSSRKFIENAGLEQTISALEEKIDVIYLEDLRSEISLFSKLISLFRSYYPEAYYRRRCRGVTPDAPCTILFTSGSEGTPKGVVLSHANLLSNYAQGKCYIDLSPTDLMFSCLPLFHSFGLNVGCLMPLLAGSKIFLYLTPLHYRVIPELVYELGATIFFAANTFLQGYARHAHPYDFMSVRYVFAGAEKLRDDTQKLWNEKFGIRILQGYGVTEASPVVAANTPMISKPGSVGHLIPGMEARVEKVEGINDGGKLLIKGPNVMLGYLLHDGDGQLHPPDAHDGSGWYDTGDIAKIDEEGFIFIQGRAKRFAKIGGEMVSLLAVEELAMQTWPDAIHAAVNLPDERKGEKIVLVTNHQEATRKQMQETARALKVGELFIPRKVLLAEELPILSTGKIDYVSLTELALAEEEDGSGWISKLANLVSRPASENEKDSKQ